MLVFGLQLLRVLENVLGVLLAHLEVRFIRRSYR